MSQYIRSRLGSVAGIVVTDFSSVVVVIVSAACVSVVFVFFIEQIVDGAPSICALLTAPSSLPQSPLSH